LALRIGYLSLQAIVRGQILPVFLFGTGVFPLLNGSFGQPTSLGFAVVLNGLCLAALRVPEEVEAPAEPDPTPLPAALPRRSAYAARLHGAADQNGRTNGLSDR
jgi:hypothetical protein